MTAMSEFDDAAFADEAIDDAIAAKHARAQAQLDHLYGASHPAYTTPREQCLDAARNAVTSRGDAYGPPVEFCQQAAKRMTLTLGVLVLPVQVPLLMCDLKQTRLAHNPAHLDSWVDTAGYAALGYEIAVDAELDQQRKNARKS